MVLRELAEWARKSGALFGTAECQESSPPPPSLSPPSPADPMTVTPPPPAQSQPEPPTPPTQPPPGDADGGPDDKYPPPPEWSSEWGKGIKWMSFEEGKAVAKQREKPLLLIVQNRKCPRCRILRNLVSTSEDFHFLSRFFAMVVVQESEVPEGQEFSPDGNYVPRVLFFDNKGALMEDVINKAAPPTMKYLYRNHWNLIKTMTETKYKLIAV